jgi:hypothetical protein
VDAANDFLRQDWIGLHNSNFSVDAEQTGTAFLPYTGTDLDKIFSRQQERIVDNDNTVRFQGRCLQIPQQTFRFSLARCRVLVCHHLDQSLTIHYGHHVLGHYDSSGQLRRIPIPSQRHRSSHRTAIMKAEAKRSWQIEEGKKNHKRKKRTA